jgi:hypothetical protein
VGKVWLLDESEVKSNAFARVSILVKASLPPNMYLCSSSSPAHNVGNGGNSGAEVKVGFDVGANTVDPTVRFRGSQKSKSCSEATERG